MKLSILTCHLIDRRQALARLLMRLVPQCCEYGHSLNWDEMLTVFLCNERLAFDHLGVEWLVDSTPKGVPDASVEGGVRPVSIGDKRNALLAKARGTHAAFIDDDDLVAHDYVARILGALQQDPDGVGFTGSFIRRGENPRKFIHSLDIKTWGEERGVFLRSLNHLNPIRLELVRQVGFAPVSHGEDHDMSKRIQPLLKTQVFLDEPPLYFYHAR